MKFAVITPYFKEPVSKLHRCRDSVLKQTIKEKGHEVYHIMVSDGFPVDEVDKWENSFHIKIPNSADYGDTPRMVGAAVAEVQDMDYALFLDADNWYEPQHIEKLFSVFEQEPETHVVTCPRRIYRLDETVLLKICPESDGESFNDTNCYMVSRNAFPLFKNWGFKDKKLGIVGDRIFWNTIKKSNAKISRFFGTPTVNYESTFAFHYLKNNEEPPENSKIIVKNDEGKFEMMNWKVFESKIKNKEKVNIA